MAFLRRNIRPTFQKAKATADRTFVQPTLEYASTTWDPHTENDIHQIEIVQRRPARFVMGDYQRKSSVTAMCQHLGLETLQQRRDRTSLTMIYRIVHHLLDIPAELYLTPMSCSRTRGHDSRYRQIQASSTVYKTSFFPRTVVLRNQLPQATLGQSNLEASQKQLAKPTC